jgi:hypothetical protein
VTADVTIDIRQQLLKYSTQRTGLVVHRHDDADVYRPLSVPAASALPRQRQNERLKSQFTQINALAVSAVA